MRYQVELFLTALQFLTRLPIPSSIPYSEERLRQSTAYYPLVGLLLGLLMGLCWWLCPNHWHPLIRAILTCSAGLILTGAFHEDGWADCWDGLGGGWTRARILEIMKDSRLGTFGSAALMLALGLRICLWWQVDPRLWFSSLLWGQTYSRYLATVLAYHCRYVGQQGELKPTASGIAPPTLALGSAWTLAAAVILQPPLASLAGPALICWGFAHYLKRRLGGYTGDCLGATQVACELTSSLAWL